MTQYQGALNIDNGSSVNDSESAIWAYSSQSSFKKLLVPESVMQQNFVLPRHTSVERMYFNDDHKFLFYNGRKFIVSRPCVSPSKELMNQYGFS